MLQIDALLQRYPGYTVRTLLDEDAETVLMLLDITAAVAAEEARRRKKHGQ
jgi:hypothetical protein